MGGATAHDIAVYIYLSSVADRDGIAPVYVKTFPNLGSNIDEILSRASLRLRKIGRAIFYDDEDNATWAWLPDVASNQPSSKYRVTADMSRRPPPQDLVSILYEKRLGRTPTDKECKDACPRSFGLKRSATGLPKEDVTEIWNYWLGFQPESVRSRLSLSTVQSSITSALGLIPKQDIKRIIWFYLTVDHPKAEDARAGGWTGLDSLLRPEKMNARVVFVNQYIDDENMCQDILHKKKPNVGIKVEVKKSKPGRFTK